MFSDKTKSRYGRQIYRLKKLRVFAAVFFMVFAVIVSVLVLKQVKNGTSNERRDLLRVWNAADFEQAYKISKNALVEKPVDYFLLTINGFSAYQLGISQINNYSMLSYIDESIRSLRNAMLLKDSKSDGRIYYVLGKAYSYKGAEYADLAVKFLEMADNLSYDAQDIPEYLGLAYAACGDYRSSVAAFSQAFAPEKIPSDNLLLSIARSYIAMEEYNMALGYLLRCVEDSPDSKSVIIARFLLADVYRTSGDYDSSEKQYLSILNDSGESAEVRYQLGELYTLKGDTTRARAEWRIANRLDPAHAKARARLNI
jgi:tetratricopeptide (TPR) repeat protein